MNKKQVDELKENLLKMKQEIINGGQLTRTDDLHVQPEDLPDDADLATNIINQQVTFNMRNRELAKLRAIEEALDRIENGVYGSCEECDEPIGFKRLKNQPFTSLCITHAEEAEREQQQHFQRAS
jgi:DnaK suppressor protein